MVGDGLDDDSERTDLDRRQTVQSVEVGMRLLIKMSRLGATVSLSHLAQQANMPASKAHRYIRALMDTGLVSQDEGTGLYRLGPEALAIGFAAMGHIDAVALSGRTMADLRDRVNETCMLCVWGNQGPAVVRIEPAARAVVVNVRLGSILPVMVSAAGLVYAAFSQERQVLAMAASERKQLRRAGKIDLLKLAEAGLERTRETGIATVRSTLTPGVSAVAAPIFDYQRHLAGVIVSLGPEAVFDASPDGRIAGELRTAAGAISRALGYHAGS